MNQWPADEGAAHRRAQIAILEAFNEEKSPEEVRQALLYAATEANLDFK
ncbi:DUF982 domain-containing protein [Rhizobium tubonense]|uniref:DUF982 domain-containing protein n=1 Tax=Rhizobium tubonense TaxID=484088 RepID=A0A2W4CPB8_9HYPH|nr:DUF982 domain-containing protein [Rhizobium tubonense]PZM14617.1 hypothetical protein CPY51_10275 [Rhizobium tubonense]